MSESPALATLPRFMRQEPHPALTPAQESAIPPWIAQGPAALSDLRSAAFAALRATGLPHSGSEDFTFIRVGEFLPHLGPPALEPPTDGASGSTAGAVASPIAGTRPTADDIERMLVDEARDSYAVLVDGAYAPSLSRPGPGFEVDTLSRTPLPAAVRDAMLRLAGEETDAVAALGMIFTRDPLVVRTAEKARPAAPLLLLHFHTGSGVRSDAVVLYHGGRLSEAELLVRHAVLSENAPPPTAVAAGSMENVHTVALLEQGASLKFREAGASAPGGTAASDAAASATAGAAPNARDIHFRKLTARLDRDSRLSVVSAHTGSRLTRHSFAVDLAGEGAEAEINGATVLTGNRQAHNFVRIRHLVPHCTSRQHFKSVAADQSRASVDGTIFVAQGAQQTNANQLINNLMLSDEARADSKPQLLIHADDVKCSHGATSGKLDPAQQFYLVSRGLPPVRARALLTVAFIAEVLEKAGTPAGAAGTPAGAAGTPSEKAGRPEMAESSRSFRDVLDHALLDTLKHRLPDAPEGGRNA